MPCSLLTENKEILISNTRGSTNEDRKSEFCAGKLVCVHLRFASDIVVCISILPEETG